MYSSSDALGFIFLRTTTIQYVIPCLPTIQKRWQRPSLVSLPTCSITLTVIYPIGKYSLDRSG